MECVESHNNSVCSSWIIIQLWPLRNVHVYSPQYLCACLIMDMYIPARLIHNNVVYCCKHSALYTHLNESSQKQLVNVYTRSVAQVENKWQP